MKEKHLFPDHEIAKSFYMANGHKLEDMLAKQMLRMKTGLLATQFDFYTGTL